MISHNDLTAMWGYGNVVRLDGAVVDKLDVPEATKAFLREVGIPRECDLEVTTDTGDDGWPTLIEYCGRIGVSPPANASRYFRFGQDGGTQLCIDTLDGGAVVSVDVAGELPTRFVNSGLDTFVESLFLYAGYCKHASGLSDRQREKLVPLFAEDLRRVDPRSLADVENWWSVVLEQIEDGLL